MTRSRRAPCLPAAPHRSPAPRCSTRAGTDAGGWQLWGLGRGCPCRWWGRGRSPGWVWARPVCGASARPRWPLLGQESPFPRERRSLWPFAPGGCPHGGPCLHPTRPCPRCGCKYCKRGARCCTGGPYAYERDFQSPCLSLCASRGVLAPRRRGGSGRAGAVPQPGVCREGGRGRRGAGEGAFVCPKGGRGPPGRPCPRQSVGQPGLAACGCCARSWRQGGREGWTDRQRGGGRVGWMDRWTEGGQKGWMDGGTEGGQQGWMD